MRNIVMEVHDNGFSLTDEQGQFVDIEHDGDISLIVSRLLGDDAAVFGSCARNVAIIEAYYLLGVE